MITPAAPGTKLVRVKINAKRHTATFTFRATGKRTGFQCALVRKPSRKGAKTPKPKYVRCPKTKTFKHLKPGTYIFYVRAVGPGGKRKPVVYRFVLKKK